MKISRHACERYLERIMDIHIDTLTDEQYAMLETKILTELSKYKDMLHNDTTMRLTVNGHEYEFKDGTLVTVKLSQEMQFNYGISPLRRLKMQKKSSKKQKRKWGFKNVEANK